MGNMYEVFRQKHTALASWSHIKGTISLCVHIPPLLVPTPHREPCLLPQLIAQRLATTPMWASHAASPQKVGQSHRAWVSRPWLFEQDGVRDQDLSNGAREMGSCGSMISPEHASWWAGTINCKNKQENAELFRDKRTCGAQREMEVKLQLLN